VVAVVFSSDVDEGPEDMGRSAPTLVRALLELCASAIVVCAWRTTRTAVTGFAPGATRASSSVADCTIRPEASVEPSSIVDTLVNGTSAAATRSTTDGSGTLSPDSASAGTGMHTTRANMTRSQNRFTCAPPPVRRRLRGVSVETPQS
jgi:hypothetical protein